MDEIIHFGRGFDLGVTGPTTTLAIKEQYFKIDFAGCTCKDFLTNPLELAPGQGADTVGAMARLGLHKQLDEFLARWQEAQNV